MPLSLSSFLKILFLATGLSAAGCRETSRWNIEPYGKIRDAELMESSGLSASGRFEDVFWTHNDDGKPLLFAINGRGRLIRSFLVPSASNQDWESIAADDAGQIYLLDNTSRIRPDRKSVIYIFQEPDPFTDTQIGGVRHIEVSCDDQAFDLEAMFHWKDRLYIVTKPWDASNPRTYRVDDLQRGGPATYIGEVPVKAMITGADISGDGKRLVLSSYRAVFIFEGAGEPQDLLRSRPLVCRLNAGQTEGITWVDEDIFMTNEQRRVYRIPKKKWMGHAAPFLKPLEMPVPEGFSAPRIKQSLRSWKSGHPIRTVMGGQPYTMGKITWTPDGLHVGIELPEGLALARISQTGPDNLSDWFAPGLVYVLLNPDGARPLTYREHDRCLVIGLSESGDPLVQARSLGPATFISHLENQPGWAKLERSGSRLLLTIGPEAPGLGSLGPGRRLGFNLLFIDGDREVISWTPLTLQYSWDAPSYWGLLEIQ